MLSKKSFLLLVAVCVCSGATALFGQTIPRSTPGLEDSLLSVLASNAPYQEKAAACRQLGTVGTGKAVPILGALLADEKLSHMARYALETIPDPAVEKALRDGLTKLEGKPLVGVIGSLGVRRDTQAVKSLAALISHSDTKVSQAALRALGSIGNQEAAHALQAALSHVPAKGQSALYEGLLRSAEVQAAQGHRQAALDLYASLQGREVPHQVRSAALRGTIVTQGPKELTQLRQCLASQDYAVVAVGAQASLELSGRPVTEVLTAGLEDRSVDQQVLIIGILGQRADLSTLSELRDLARQGKQPTRLAALGALARMGHSSSVALLVELSDDSDPEVAQAATAGLAHFPGASADAAVLTMLASERKADRLSALGLIGQRRMKASMPALLDSAADPDSDTRSQALKSIAQLGGADELPALLVLLPRMTRTKDLDALRQALTDVCGRAGDPEACVGQLIERLSQVDTPQKVALLRVLSSVGGPRALEVVCAAVDDSDEDVQLGALRVLAAWQSADAAPKLLSLVKTSEDAKVRTLSLRGYLNMARRREVPTNRRLTMCQEVAPFIQQTAEKNQWLGALGQINSPKALGQIMPYFDDPAVQETACAVSVAMIERLTKRNARLKKNPQVMKALERILDVSANANYRARAKKIRSSS